MPEAPNYQAIDWQDDISISRSADQLTLINSLKKRRLAPVPLKSVSRKLAHCLDFAQFITIALLLCPQWTIGMCDRCAGNFPRGARNRKVAEAAK
jgi:hypothetical protein